MVLFRVVVLVAGDLVMFSCAVGCLFLVSLLYAEIGGFDVFWWFWVICCDFGCLIC